MKYFLDTEFHEYKKNGTNTIELISIGIVRENGDEIYEESSEFDMDAAIANEWLAKNVVNNLILSQGLRRSNEDIGKSIIRFIGEDKPEFYGYFADYDWVVFCWLFGRMIDLPKGFPFYCMDIKQMMKERGLSTEWKKQVCPDPKGEHNAIIDARWNKKLFDLVMGHKIISTHYAGI